MMGTKGSAAGSLRRCQPEGCDVAFALYLLMTVVLTTLYSAACAPGQRVARL